MVRQGVSHDLGVVFSGAQMKTTHNLRLLCAQVLDLCQHKPHTVGYAVSFFYLFIFFLWDFFPLCLHSLFYTVAFCVLGVFIVSLLKYTEHLLGTHAIQTDIISVIIIIIIITMYSLYRL